MRRALRSGFGAAHVVGLGLLLASCAAQRPVGAPNVPDGQNRVEVVTTVVPITLFTRAVAGGCARVTPLIPAPVSPHDFQATPADLAALRRARLLVENGLGMERFLDQLVASADNPQLLRLDTSAGVQRLPVASASRSVHDQEEDQGHHHGHRHGAVNPHIWLDPLRAIQQVNAIRDALIKVDPSCAEGYRRRAEAYREQLRQLDRDLAAQLRPFRGRTFVAFHDIAPYFAQRYGLKVVALVDVPEQNPSPADLLQVAQVAKSNQLKALLREPRQSAGSFNNLAKDLDLKIMIFDPIETSSERESKDPSFYLRQMRRNGQQLQSVWAH